MSSGKRTMLVVLLASALLLVASARLLASDQSEALCPYCLHIVAQACQ